MSLILRGAALIDGTGREPLSESAVVIDGNRVSGLHGDATSDRRRDAVSGLQHHA